MKKKPTLEDLNAWKKFTSGSEALYNKDINFKKKQNSYIIKKIDLHGFTLENANESEAFGITLEPEGGSETPTLEQLYTLGAVGS